MPFRKTLTSWFNRLFRQDADKRSREALRPQSRPVPPAGPPFHHLDDGPLLAEYDAKLDELQEIVDRWWNGEKANTDA